MMNTRYIYIVLIFILLTGCQKNRFSDGVINTVSFPDHDPKIAATLLIEQESERFYALLRSSASVENSNTSTGEILDAEITIEDENTVLFSTQDASIEYDGEFYSSNVLSEIELLEENLIFLTINANGFNPINAETYMPLKPLVDTLKFTPVSETFETEDYSDVVDKIDFTLNESGELDKYFKIDVEVTYYDTLNGQEISQQELENKGIIYFNIFSPDPRVSTFNIENSFSQEDGSINSLLLTDQQGLSNIIILLEHGIKNVQAWGPELTPLEIYNSIDIRYNCKISALSASLYNHYFSVNENYQSFDNPFAEPQLTYTNIQPEGEGFGCFGMSNSINLIIN